MKRVFIIHGWYDPPNGSWFGWLKSELEKRNFEAGIKIEKVTTHTKKFISILSDDDPYVPLDNQDGVTELPIVLEKILEMAR